MNFRLLIADDDRDDFHTLIDAFGEIGLNPWFDHVTDGRALLEHLQCCMAGECERPDVILLDLNMPRVDGIQALKEIRSLPGTLIPPVLIYTTTNDPYQKQQCLAHGASGFVTKGSSFSAIVSFARDLAEFIAEARMNPEISFHRRKNEV